MPAIKIAPSILAADFTRLGDEIRTVEKDGAQVIHIDVMDGRFVPNISMGAFVVEAARRVTQLPLDVHLMIVEPEHHIEAFAKAGATMITVHQEVSPHLHRTLQAIHGLGVKAGVALNPSTPAETLSEILHMVDLVLVMSVNPGFGGQVFIPEVLPKIRKIRQMLGTRDIDVSVDGGITATTAPLVVQAGANLLVAGNSVFKTANGLVAIRRAIQ